LKQVKNVRQLESDIGARTADAAARPGAGAKDDALTGVIQPARRRVDTGALYF